ncbi:MAG: ADP-ribosylglycohydrolase family protein [Parcubacteria group bacterium]|nr:ADP-ribosylglycohydrolase family protein [Parcubacteria group bacterium]
MAIISTQDKIHGCLLGVMIGDAMGMPWEIMSHDEIINATNGKGVTSFHDPVQTRIRDTMSLRAGDTTDDWQLTQVVARSLIKNGGYNHIDCAKEHIEELERTTLGWGGSTRRGIERVQKFFREHPDATHEIMRHHTFCNPKGCGNGIAMKVSPLALWNALRFLKQPECVGISLYSHIMNLGSLTHGDPRASFCAYSVGRAIISLITQYLPVSKKKLGLLSEQSPALLFLQEIIGHTQWAEWDLEKFIPVTERQRDTISSRLKKIIEHNLVSSRKEEVRSILGVSSFAPESIPFSIATFLRHPYDFRRGILEAVNAGGDTDTNASIVGALIGAHIGVQGIPHEWRFFRKEFEEAGKIANALYDAYQ